MGNGWFTSRLRKTNTFLPHVGASEIERVHGEWLVVVRCDANDVCFERVLRKSNLYVYFGYGCFEAL